MIPVEGHNNLYRDEKTGAILSTDSNGYSNYLSQKKKNSDQQAELDTMKREIEELTLMSNELASKITS